MKQLQHLFFFAFLISLTGFGGEIMATTNDALLSCIKESRELRESEESSSHHHLFEDQKIRHVGAGGSGLEEPEDDAPQKNAPQLSPISVFFNFVPNISYFSLTTYYTSLFHTLYFPKLYILFHCPKAFLL